MDKRFIHDIKAQIEEKIQVRKNLVLKNFRLIDEIKNNVKRRKDLTREIRDLRYQLSHVKSAVKKTPKTRHEVTPGKVNRINFPTSGSSDI